MTTSSAKCMESSDDENRATIVSRIAALAMILLASFHSVAEELRVRGDFAYLELSSIQYYPPRSAIYVTIDAVEHRDKTARMPFRKTPAPATYSDPDELLAKWHEYSQAVSSLMRSGEINQGECEVVHCIAPFGINADLSPYLAVFNDGATKHEDLLYEIAVKHPNPYSRARAIFLLAHTADIEGIMSLLSVAMFDSSSLVRNNAMRVMIMMAESDPELRFQLKQPNNHNGAYELLKTISGEDYGPRNYDAWIEWSETQSACSSSSYPLGMNWLFGRG